MKDDGDDGDDAEVGALDRTDEADLGLGDDSFDEDSFDNEAAGDLDRAVETEAPSEDSDRRSPVRVRCRKGCGGGYTLSRYHRCRCVPTSRRCSPGYTYQRICTSR